MKVLVTGGAGYIGSHVARALEEDGQDVAVLDDMSTGLRERLGETQLFEGSVLDSAFVANSLRHHGSDAVIHLAAKKAVEESVAEPLKYYRENVVGMHSLLTAMASAGVKKLVFSSSAAVYGVPKESLVTENSPTIPESPYGSTKLMCEQMLRDVGAAENYSWVALRYFNVAGTVEPRLADRGENNLVPRVFRAITSGRNPQIFGNSYPTRDGTCIRDYIHVGDVADAHAAAVKHLGGGDLAATYNIGTGTGTSVLEVMEATRRITGIGFSWDFAPPRAGDPAEVVADAARIRTDFDWHSRHDLDTIISSAWQAWSKS